METLLIHFGGGGPEGPRKFVAARLSAWSGLHYDWRSQVVVTSGGDSLAAVFEALARPSGEVVTIAPRDAASRRPSHRRTKTVALPWLAASASVWAEIAIACLRADAWLVLDARGISAGQPDGSHPAALPGMAGRTITVGSMCAGAFGWIVGPKRIISAIAQIDRTPTSLPAA
jgi:N-succinyldiaminopimelate aminotransferase